MVQLTDEILTPLYYAMGVIVVHWSYVEQPIDMWVALVYHNCGGKPHAEKQQIPRSFSSKIKYLRKTFEKIKPLAPFKKQGSSLIDRAELLSIKRNDMIHMRLCKAHGNGTFDFFKFDYTKSMHEIRRLTYSINDLLQFGKKMMDLVKDLTDYCHLLGQHFLPSKQHQQL